MMVPPSFLFFYGKNLIPLLIALAISIKLEIIQFDRSMAPKMRLKYKKSHHGTYRLNVITESNLDAQQKQTMIF